MWIKSHWRVTWDPSGTPLVLLDWGDLTPNELEIPVEQEIQRESLIGAAWAAVVPRGNLSRQITVARLESYATSHELRYASFTTSIAAEALQGLTKTIRVEILTGGTTGTQYSADKAFANCVFVSHKIIVAPSGTRLLREWTFAAGASS
jgi:hypothetical protein